MDKKRTKTPFLRMKPWGGQDGSVVKVLAVKSDNLCSMLRTRMEGGGPFQ